VAVSRVALSLSFFVARGVRGPSRIAYTQQPLQVLLRPASPCGLPSDPEPLTLGIALRIAPLPRADLSGALLVLKGEPKICGTARVAIG
jgi:hypothetical protein